MPGDRFGPLEEEMKEVKKVSEQLGYFLQELNKYQFKLGVFSAMQLSSS